MSATRIIIVEDEPLFRELLRSQLSNDPEIEVVGEADTGELAIELAKAVNDKPSIIIAITVPGKGVKEFERKPEWHGKPPSKEEGERALEELRS